MAIRLNMAGGPANWKWSDSSGEFIEGIKPSRAQKDALIRKHTRRNGELDVLEYNAALLKVSVTNWGGFVDESGKEIPYSKEMIEAFVDALSVQASRTIIECSNVIQESVKVEVADPLA